VQITVGRHAADDGDRVHPLVAAALEARQTPPPGATSGTHRHDGPVVVVSSSGSGSGTTPGGEGPVGWPGAPGDGTGLGWPADTDGQDQPTPVEAPSSKRLGMRLGWRRFTRRGEKSRSDTSAA
jgi:hypothetical protein